MIPYDDLFLSPHLDDAVFSCAGHILRAIDEGQRVRVATVFSHPGECLSGDSFSGESDSTEACDTYTQRRQEDARALALLGADHSWLAMADAPFRHGGYRSYESLLLGPIRDSDQERRRIQEAVLAEVRRCRPRTIHLPLAVGTHVDHRLVFDLWPLLREHGNLRFYEDRPYAQVAQALHLRLRQLGSKVSGPQVSAAPDLAGMSPRKVLTTHFQGWRQVRFVKAHLTPGVERLRCAQAVARQLRKPPATDGPSFTFEVDDFSPAEVNRIQAAIACYESQLDAFVGQPGEIPSLLRDYAESIGSSAAHAERRWRLI